ncbi:MAG: type II toxin-antitoxin system VapC family toxin [Blastocatellia bacterium]|nr:type II toxin-antitoxin system VapC family toxin [Blastocatellia bacterium]
MSFLIDTNIFLRLVPKNDPDRQVVVNALRKLRSKKEDLYYTTQVLAEFWTVCTRPVTARGGYGLTSLETERRARPIERYCKLLTESLATHQEWRRLIMVHSVQGVLIHDARTVSVMNLNGITHILTFDKDDFKRYSNIIALSPVDL